MKKINFAILGPGNIANTMARTVTQMDHIRCYAVASRSKERAQKFADQWGFEKVYDSYDKMVQDPEVEFVYVCTPHSHHYQCAKMCLEHGKHVLVEKAFTVDALQAADLIRIAESKGLLLAEAIWTRYMPSRKMIDDLLSKKVIGEVTSVMANLGYSIGNVERLRKPELAGGALLDLGVYTIQFALMVMKDEIKKISSDAVLSSEGIDLMNSITFSYANDRMAVLHNTMLAQTNRMGIISGTEGYIEVQNINNCEQIRVFNKAYELTAAYPVPKQITGFEYQVESCIHAIETGKTECVEMPHSDIIKVMKIMDEIRLQWGMKFPCEGI